MVRDVKITVLDTTGVRTNSTNPLIVIFIALFLCFMNALDRPFALGILVLFTLIYIYIIFKFIIRYRKVL